MHLAPSCRTATLNESCFASQVSATGRNHFGKHLTRLPEVESINERVAIAAQLDKEGHRWERFVSVHEQHLLQIHLKATIGLAQLVDGASGPDIEMIHGLKLHFK